MNGIARNTLMSMTCLLLAGCASKPLQFENDFIRWRHDPQDGSLTGAYLDIEDPEKIAQILAACMPGELGTSWQKPQELPYELEFWHKDGITGRGDYVTYAMFKDDSLPSFLAEAFGD